MLLVAAQVPFFFTSMVAIPFTNFPLEESKAKVEYLVRVQAL